MPQNKPRLVIDTNVFVSSLFGKTSRKVVDLWRDGEVVLLASKAVLGEYEDILSRFHFRKSLKPLLEDLRSHHNMEVLTVRRKKRVVPDDPEDDKFIHCAEVGNADAIVSGDEHILRLKSFYDEIPIATASEFLKRIWPEISRVRE